MAQKDTTALRKRQQITQSNKTMFLWVAGASILIGMAGVISIFLIQRMVFNQRVLNEKSETISVLRDNNIAIEELKKNIRVLETNEALNDSKAKSDDKALQVILDALPADANSLALGSSLQNKFINGIDNITLESLTVDPVSGIENSGEEALALDAEPIEGEALNPNSVNFRLSVSSTDANALKELLQRFEKSIRVIDILSLTLERSEDKLTMGIEASAYFEPAKKIELQDKVVKP